MPKRGRESEVTLSFKKSKKSPTFKAANKAMRMKKYGSPVDMSPEVKVIDTSISDAALTNAGSVIVVNACSEGTTGTTRVGRKINMTSVEYWAKLTCGNSQTGQTASNDAIRVSIVYDHQVNQAAPAYSDIYTSSGTSSAPLGYRSINNLDRFEVLATDTFNFDASSNITAVAHRYVPIKWDTRYDTGNAGTVADIISGGLFVVICPMFAAAGAQAGIVGVARVRFQDL